MLALHLLLKQLTDEQLLALEASLQEAVSYNSKTLLIFNCAMLGLTAEETIEEGFMSKRTYHKYSRAIYNSVNDLFELKAESQADKLLAEVHYAVHNEEFESKREKIERFELFFHLLKKNQLEQESYLLLAELNELHRDTPLEAVYSHLYAKYLRYSEINEMTLSTFIEFNKKLSSFIASNETEEKEVLVRDMIRDYKMLRQHLESYENNNLKAIYMLSKLALVQVCNQQQLLLEEKLSHKDLLKQAKAFIAKLPFGTEKYFLQNIFWQLDNVKSAAKEENYPAASQQGDCNNFSFPTLVKVPVKRTFKLKNRKTQKVISHTRFIKYRKISNRLSTSISTINLPRGSMSYSAT